jgi:hypothetical protein
MDSETGGTRIFTWSIRAKELGRADFTKIPNDDPGIEELLMLIYQGLNQRRLMSA